MNLKADYLPQIISLEGAESLSWPDGQPVIFECESCSSALDVSWNLLRHGRMKAWDSVLAGEQTSGRGQLRRSWVSPRGNVHAALCLPSGIGGDAASIQTGWLVIKAMLEIFAPHLSAFQLAGLKLKWPNDLIWMRLKVGGILLEQKGECLIAGIGVNLAHSPDTALLRDGFAFPAGSLAGLLPDSRFVQNLSPLDLWLSLVSMMRFWYETKALFKGGVLSLPQAEPELAFLGERVRVFDHNAAFGSFDGENGSLPAECVGRFLGLGPGGELKLGASGGEILIPSGSLYPA